MQLSEKKPKKRSSWLWKQVDDGGGSEEEEDDFPPPIRTRSPKNQVSNGKTPSKHKKRSSWIIWKEGDDDGGSSAHNPLIEPIAETASDLSSDLSSDDGSGTLANSGTGEEVPEGFLNILASSVTRVQPLLHSFWGKSRGSAASPPPALSRNPAGKRERTLVGRSGGGMRGRRRSGSSPSGSSTCT